MQAAARELAPDHRIRHCLRAVIPHKDCVEVWLSEASRKAYYMNLMCCGAVWVCPVCAAKISERRRTRLDTALNVTDRLPIVQSDGTARIVLAPRYYLSMATFTIRHHQGESAREVIRRLKAVYKATWSGRYALWFKQTYRVVGTIRAIELTHGQHGWHPHYHLLMIRESANTENTVKAMDLELSLRWLDMCESVGASATLEHGVKVSAGDNRAHEYLDKLGQSVGEAINRWALTAEMTKYVVKHGRQDSRTMWDLLIAYTGHDVKAGELWIEGINALKGTAHLRTSNGLWKLLGINGIDAKDETLAGDVQNAADGLLARLTLSQWQTVIRVNARGRLLQIAQDGGEIDAYIKGMEKIRES